MTNIETTQAIFTAFGAGDIPAILAHLDEHIVIEFYGPRVIPYAGTYQGRQQAREFFETVLSSVRINEFTPDEFLADVDKVVVTGHLNLDAIATGRTIDSDFVHVITLADGKWTRFRDFMNTAIAVAAFASN
ncbi:MAG: nuclear transport factor 2 family protein [Gammaproteobacteria bacterium]